MNKEEEYVGLVTIDVVESLLRAMVIRGALESAGIPVVLNYETTGTRVEPGTGNGVGRVEVMVPTEWEDEAEKLVHAQPRSGEVFSVPPDVQVES
jgi:hypothetical protein